MSHKSRVIGRLRHPLMFTSKKFYYSPISLTLWINRTLLPAMPPQGWIRPTCVFFHPAYFFPDLPKSSFPAIPRRFCH